MTPPIKSLPTELLQHILSSLDPRYNHADIFNCILVCKSWLSGALKVLYQDVQLSNSSLHRFVCNLTEPNAAKIKKLYTVFSPIKLGPCPDYYMIHNPPESDSVHLENEDQARATGSSGTKVLWKDLRFLGQRLPMMSSLKSFSLSASQGSTVELPGFWIPNTVLADVMVGLPTTCTALELDLKGLDPHGGDEIHLCRRIRTLMPQLQHLRLRLGSLCPDFFTSPDSTPRLSGPYIGQSAGDSEKELSNASITATRLQTLNINVILDPYGDRSTHTCQSYPFKNYRGGGYDDHMDLLTALRSARQAGAFPQDASLTLVRIQPNASITTIVKYSVRTDKALARALAIPTSQKERKWFKLHQVDGGEMVGVDDAIELVAESSLITQSFTFHEASLDSPFVRDKVARLRAQSLLLGPKEWQYRYAIKRAFLMPDRHAVQEMPDAVEDSIDAIDKRICPNDY